MIKSLIKKLFGKENKKEVSTMLALPLVPPLKINSLNVFDYIILDNDEIIFHSNKPLSTLEEEYKSQEVIKEFLKENNKIKLITMIKNNGVPVNED